MAKPLRLITLATTQPTIVDLWPRPIAAEYHPHETCFCIADALLSIHHSYTTLPEVVTYASYRHQDRLILVSAPSGREIHLLLSLGPLDTEVSRYFAQYQQQLTNAVRRHGRSNPHRSTFARAFIATLVEVLAPAGLLDDAGQVCRTLGLWPGDNEGENFARWLNRSSLEVRKNTPSWRELPRPVARGVLGTVAAACTEAGCANDANEHLRQVSATLGMTLVRYQRRSQ